MHLKLLFEGWFLLIHHRHTSTCCLSLQAFQTVCRSFKAFLPHKLQLKRHQNATPKSSRQCFEHISMHLPQRSSRSRNTRNILKEQSTAARLSQFFFRVRAALLDRLPTRPHTTHPLLPTAPPRIRHGQKSVYIDVMMKTIISEVSAQPQALGDLSMMLAKLFQRAQHCFQTPSPKISTTQPARGLQSALRRPARPAHTPNCLLHWDLLGGQISRITGRTSTATAQKIFAAHTQGALPNNSRCSGCK